MSKKHVLLSILLSLVFLLGGFAAMKALVASRQAPAREARPDPGVLAEVMVPEAGTRRMEVTGTGTVRAHRSLSLVPQVSGQVIEISSRLVEGGMFRKGELLFAIDPADYELALAQAEAALAQARLSLALTQSQAGVARQEWERLGGGEPDNPLVLMTPQLEQERAKVVSAEASVKRALLDLERTRLIAPFNALVRSRQVEIGQYLRSGSPVAELSGTDLAEVRIPLSLEDSRWLPPLPVPARVSLHPEGAAWSWPGRLVRSLGEVDPASRMVQMVIEVKDPYGLEDGSGQKPALALGHFVEAAIEGRTLENVFELPRRALRADDRIWVAGADNRLRILDARVLRGDADSVLLRADFAEGDRVVLSGLPGAASGMLLRPMSKEARP